jgi:hypothetical protein
MVEIQRSSERKLEPVTTISTIANNMLIHSVELHIDPELTNHQDLVMKAKIWIRSNAIFHPLPHNMQVRLSHRQRALETLS